MGIKVISEHYLFFRIFIPKKMFLQELNLTRECTFLNILAPTTLNHFQAHFKNLSYRISLEIFQFLQILEKMV